jgi:hypothetical protein
MKASPTMEQFVQALIERHGVDLTPLGAYLRLDLPEQDSLVIDHVGVAQVAVALCFVAGGVWQIEREVVFFTGHGEWIPMEITQAATGWMAYAKVDGTGQRLVRISPCGQEKLAEFSEQWAQKLLRQKWLEAGEVYQYWLPPSRKEVV